MADYSKEELDRTFCKLIFSENNDSQSETTSKNFSMFLELIIPLRKQKRWHIPYDLTRGLSWTSRGLMHVSEELYLMATRNEFIVCET